MKKNIIISIITIVIIMILSSCSFATTGNIIATLDKEKYNLSEEVNVSIKITEDMKDFLYFEVKIGFDTNYLEFLSATSNLNNGKINENMYNPSTNVYMLQLKDAIDIRQNDEIVNIKFKVKDDIEINELINTKISFEELYYCDINDDEYEYEGENAQVLINISKTEEERDPLYLSTLSNSKYKIGENDTKNYEQGDKYIARISPNTSIKSFKDNLKTNGNISVYNANGEEETNFDKLVKTGMTIKVTKEDAPDEIIELTIIVLGDANGNGKIDMGDTTALRAKLYEGRQLTEIERKALDIRFTGAINTSILTIIRNVLYEGGILDTLL